MCVCVCVLDLDLICTYMLLYVCMNTVGGVLELIHGGVRKGASTDIHGGSRLLSFTSVNGVDVKLAKVCVLRTGTKVGLSLAVAVR